MEKSSTNYVVSQKTSLRIHKVSTVSLNAKSILTYSHLLEPIKKLTVTVSWLYFCITYFYVSE